MTTVAIDGPAGAGKSTIARAVAERLGYIYVDTGALYRAIGLYALRRGVNPESPEEVTPLLGGFSLELVHRGGEQRVLLNGEDVSEAIRAPEMGMAASQVSAIPEVREYLLGLQRQLAEKNNVVMDGRDIGTVVLPNADVKIYLTASVEQRARRRYDEHLAKGQQVQYNIVLEEMKRRDHKDMNRSTAPLRQAENAVLADTSSLTLEQSISLVLNLVKDGTR